MPSHDTATATVITSSRTEAGTAHADRRLLIDGRFVTTDRAFPSGNPPTGHVIGHAPDAGTDEAAAAIAAARHAFDTTSWSTDVELRVRCLEQLHQALLEVGREMGVAGIEEFLERKTFAVPVPGVA